MSSTPEFRREFVQRLTWACDESPHIPPKGEGRQQVIAERLGVTSEALSKWFKAVSMPRPTKMRELAELLGVDEGWLHYGRQPVTEPREARLRAKFADGAVHLVWGHIALSGGHCGLPSPNDPKADSVDFYATVKGSTYPIRVVLAREIESGKFEIVVPKEFRDVRTIAVIPASPGKYHFIDLASNSIEKHKTLKVGDFVVDVERQSGSRYSTDGTHWQRIITFGEFAQD